VICGIFVSLVYGKEGTTMYRKRVFQNLSLAIIAVSLSLVAVGLARATTYIAYYATCASNQPCSICSVAFWTSDFGKTYCAQVQCTGGPAMKTCIQNQSEGPGCAPVAPANPCSGCTYWLCNQVNADGTCAATGCKNGGCGAPGGTYFGNIGFGTCQ
jgi:hypothetical protein